MIIIELIAALGIAEIQGMNSKVTKNKKLAVKAAILVFPPEVITAAFSAEDTVGEVPKKHSLKLLKP